MLLTFFLISISLCSSRFAKGMYLDTPSNSLVHDSLQNVNRVFLDVRVFKLDRCVNEPKRGNVFNFMKSQLNNGEVKLYFYYEFKPEESVKDLFEDDLPIVVRAKALMALDTANGHMVDSVFTVKHIQNNPDKIILNSHGHNVSQTLDAYHFHLIFEIVNLSNICKKYDKTLFSNWVNHFKYTKGVNFHLLDSNEILRYTTKLMNTLINMKNIKESERKPYMFDDIKNNISCFILNNMCSDKQESDLSSGAYEYVDKKKHDITYHLHLFLIDLYNFLINLCFSIKSLDKTGVFTYNKNSQSITLRECWIFDILEGNGINDNIGNISVVLYGSADRDYLHIPHFFDKAKRKIIIDFQSLDNHLLDFHSVVLFYNINEISKSQVISTETLYNSLRS